MGQISRRHVCVADEAHQLGVGGREDAVADPVGPQRLDDLADLLGARRALLADVDRDPEPGLAGGLDQRRKRRVVVARASGPRAGDVDADDAAATPSASAFSTMTSFWRASKVRSIIRISPARPAGTRAGRGRGRGSRRG